jgi:hypothetical protein
MELKLYEITDDYLEIVDELMHNGGELTEELENALQVNEENMYEKLENYAKFIRQKESLIKVRKEEINRLNALNKTDQTLIDNLKSRVDYAMNLYNKDKVETSLFKFSFRKSISIEITDENSVPEDFKKREEVVKISKTDIKNYLKEHGLTEIQGARLVENKNLNIK